MSTQNSQSTAPESARNALAFHFDVGHSSIGWAATADGGFIGAGVALFQPDGALAGERRMFRRQRRHIRSTRNRIARMKAALAHIGALDERELSRPGCAWPWKLAAEALAGGRKLTWAELWDVLRWYAHNRGYDGNALWKRGGETADDKETRESVEQAHNLMRARKTDTFCETMCAVLGVEPGGEKRSSRIRYKAANASFPRGVVAKELQAILEAHRGILPGLDDALIRCIMGNPLYDPLAWQAAPCPGVKLPKRYLGGLLFGQLAPRFDNRIIGECPISKEKLPLKSCVEFLEFRWAAFMANLRVCVGDGMRALCAAERAQLTVELRAAGAFTKKSLQKALSTVAQTKESNVDAMMIIPDSEEALSLHPALKELLSAPFASMLTDGQKRKLCKILQRRGKLEYDKIRAMLPPEQTALFDAALADAPRARKNAKPKTALSVKYPAGRAPYARGVMRKAVAEIMQGADPRAKGGCLCRDAAKEDRVSENELDCETNNHLVRHRLHILSRLLDDLIKEYASGDASKVTDLTVEVNREVKELSGKKAKQIAAEMGLRLASHKKAVEKIAEDLDLNKNQLTALLIRKARIAMDMGWQCPYTGEHFDMKCVESKSVDLDHIIPRSERQSDSLDSLALTFKEVNAFKKARTALQFIKDEQGKEVPSRTNLMIRSEEDYKKFVESLKPNGSHADDIQRFRNRKRNLTTLEAKDVKGFTPGALTQTSFLTTLACRVLRGRFSDDGKAPRITAIPGRITGEVRKAWDLIGLLATVNPNVKADDGSTKNKTEIREITHLHHAVDAATLALAATLMPNDGRFRELLAKRHRNNSEQNELLATGMFQRDGKGCLHLIDLPEHIRENIRKCLGENRVVYHVPKRKRGGVFTQNAQRLVSVDDDGMAKVRQRKRGGDGRITVKTDDVNTFKLIGVSPDGESKLQKIKAVLEINGNYGVALDPTPKVIPFHKVWRRIGEIKKANGGVMPRILRNGDIIHVAKGTYAGMWRIASVKNNTDGIALSIARADAVKTAKANCLLHTIMKDGLTIMEHTLTGVPQCHTTSSISTPRSAQSPAKTSK